MLDYSLDTLNKQGLYEGKIIIIQPIRGEKSVIIKQQKVRYNLFLRGIKNSEEICEHAEIHSVSRGVDPYSDFDGYLKSAESPDMRFIISNTTEAGIEFDESCAFSDKPALSFPGKLTQLLYHRFELKLPGFVVLPCELIDSNGNELKKCVLRYADLWNLGEGFTRWIENENTFCNTLVDRIVTGYPKDEAEELGKNIGYDDKLMNTAEPFHLWVIEGDFENELPLKKSGLNVVWTDDVSPYKKMKVRILNGSHTALVFPSLICDTETVKDSLDDELLKEYLNACLSRYILPTVGETKENFAFAKSVIERFSNPYIKHLWKSIALNSVSKFSVRVLPTILEYEKSNGILPKPLVFSLACLIEYYKTKEPQDNEKTVCFIKENSIHGILSNTEFWGENLSRMTELVTESIGRIHTHGIREAIKWAMS